MSQPIVLAMPFTGRWLVQNSPARRVPSHGTNLFGTRYAIDFVGVDERGRTADRTDWRTAFATEPPERFVAFGRPILAPADGVVVATHDGEPDHEGRRSQATLVPYVLGQAARVRRGGHVALAGNHVVIALPEARAFVALVHLQRGSLAVAPGDAVTTGQVLGSCGNSGNSTQPHVHVQVMDGPDATAARGLPMAFRDYREWPGRRTLAARPGEPRVVDAGIPAEGAIVEPLTTTAS